MMDFDDKDIIMQKISQMGTMYQKLMQYMQMALGLAQQVDPMLAQKIMEEFAMMGGEVPSMSQAAPHIAQSDNIGGIPKEEHSIVTKARQQSNDAAQPNSDGVIADRGMRV
jgi:uncharacterized protein (UPF0303 family)